MSAGGGDPRSRRWRATSHHSPCRSTPSPVTVGAIAIGAMWMSQSGKPNSGPNSPSTIASSTSVHPEGDRQARREDEDQRRDDEEDGCRSHLPGARRRTRRASATSRRPARRSPSAAPADSADAATSTIARIRRRRIRRASARDRPGSRAPPRPCRAPPPAALGTRSAPPRTRRGCRSSRRRSRSHPAAMLLFAVIAAEHRLHGGQLAGDVRQHTERGSSPAAR